MHLHKYSKRTRLACSAEQLYDWHSRPEAFIELQPPWERVEQLGSPEPLHEGQLVRIRIRVGPLALRWDSLISELSRPAGFTDVQKHGPFLFWRHRHSFVDNKTGGCTLHDQIEYRLPLGWLGEFVAGRMVRQRLDRMFSYRHALMLDRFGSE
ncbi:MAG: SRPBCC family protein [Planctomycetales bacterium]|nr:SRPBCC family protein [bacterium]UNM07429.1 MAG: SRPBCC family protein [Planctomycetales bacterium]